MNGIGGRKRALGWLLAVGLGGTGSALAQSLELSPARGAREGGDLLLRAQGLAASATYEAMLVAPLDPRLNRSLGSASSSSGGDLELRASLPQGSAGNRVVRLLRAGNAEVERSLSIGAGLQVAVSPASPKAGQRVEITVNGLAGGDLTLLYGGVAIHGPQTVSPGSERIRLRVPTRWPASLPATVELQAVQGSARTTAARGWRALSVQPASTQPTLRAVETSLPPAIDDPRAPFTASLRVESEDNDIDEHLFNVYFRSEAGVSVPLGQRTIRPRLDGSFDLRAMMPSILSQDFRLPRGPGSVMLIGQNSGPDTSGIALAGSGAGARVIEVGRLQVDMRFFERTEKLVVLVRDAGTGELLRNAFVGIRGLELFGSEPDPVAEAHGLGYANQLTASTPLEYKPSEFAGCEFNAYRAQTDGNGRVEFDISVGDLQSFLIWEYLRRCRAPVDGGTICNPLGEGARFPIELYVSAAHLGYTPTASGNTCEQFQQGLSVIASEDGESVEIYDDFGRRTTPLVVNMFRNEAACGAGVGEFTVAYGPAGSGTNQILLPRTQVQIGGGIRRIVHTPLATAPDSAAVPNSVLRRGQAGWQARFEFDRFIANATIATATLHFDSNGDGQLDYVAPFAPMQTLSDTSCGQGADEYAAPFPDFARYPAGARNGEVRVVDSRGRETRHYLRLRFAPIPDWFDVRDPSFLPGSMEAFLSGAAAGIYRGTLSAIRKAQGANLTTGNLPKGIGSLRTDSDNDVQLTQTFSLSEYLAIEQRVISRNEVANNAGAPKLESGSAAPGSQIPFGLGPNGQPLTQLLIDTGKIPLFRAAWGIPPIADATLGADFWLQSLLKFHGAIGAGADGAPRITNYVSPSLDLGVDLWFNLQAVLGLVSARATASAGSSLSMTATTVDNQLISTQSCFGFVLGANVRACIAGFCPFNEDVCFVDNFTPASCNFCNTGGLNLTPDPRCLRLPFSCALPSSGKQAKRTPVPMPAPQNPALASDGRGNALLLYAGANGLMAQSMGLGLLGDPQPVLLDPGRRPDSIAVTFLGPNRALAVWASSDTAPADGSVDSLRAAAQRMHLRWARWDGVNWTVPADLTAPGTRGDGNVALAACSGLRTLACGIAGEATLVFIRDRVGDFEQGRFSVMHARYTPSGGWGRIDPLDDTEIRGGFDPSDMQPAVTYLGSKPAVVFLRGGSEGNRQYAQRQIAYRIIGDGPVRIASTLPRGASWPSVTSDGTQLVLAYTAATDSTGFVGNRNALNLARATCNAGTCSFTNRELRDARGRQLRGESPTVMMEAPNKAVIAFRGLAFGPDAGGVSAYPDDPVGMLTGAGALIELRSDFSPAAVIPVSIADGLQVHFQPAAVLDAALGGVLAVSMGQNVINPGLFKVLNEHFPGSLGGRSKGLEVSEDLQIYAVGSGHDLAIDLDPIANLPLAAGGTLALTPRLSNRGSDFVPEPGEPTRLVATWDEPFGVAAEAASANIDALSANASRSIAMQVPMPADAQPDERRWLYLRLAGPGADSDRTAADNQLRIALGGLPTPQNLMASTRPGGRVVQLGWDDPEDPRIAGYRVYASTGDDDWEALGSTPVAGFADLTLDPGTTRLYRVASYSDRGLESASSATAAAAVVLDDKVFSDGFEPRQ